MRTRALSEVALFALLAVVVPQLSRAGAATDLPAPVLCSEASLQVSAVVDTASQALGPWTIFEGSVRFTNTGPRCVLVPGRVRTRAENGLGTRHWPVGSSSTGPMSKRLVLKRGDVVSLFARVDATPPKGWKTGARCAEAVFAGLLVSGPMKGWSRFVPSYPNSPACSAYHRTTTTGALQASS